MIITRTPFRISLFGGGTDFPEYFDEYGGSVLGFALDKYCWISLRELPPFYNYRYRIVYSKDETVKKAEDIQHPFVRKILSEYEHLNGHNGFEIHYDGDIPARTGLGSSSSFAVGFLKAISQFYKVKTLITQKNIAEAAIYYERNVLNEAVGCQDQIWAAYGGFNRIDFTKGDFRVEYIFDDWKRTKELIDHLMLFFTGFQRFASGVEAVKLTNYKSKITQLHRIKELVDVAGNLLQDEKKPITDIGLLLHETWCMKKELAKDVVTNDNLDSIYNTGLGAGALGGKLLGAGGGGFFLFLVPPEKQNHVRKALRSLIEIPVGIDWDGSVYVTK